MIMNVLNVIVKYPDDMPEKEAKEYVKQEIALWLQESPDKRIGGIVLEIDGDDVIIKAIEKSPIRRVRRITGYLSVQENFNDSKRAELKDRVSHV
jgi:hypothetical protein